MVTKDKIQSVQHNLTLSKPKIYCFITLRRVPGKKIKSRSTIYTPGREVLTRYIISEQRKIIKWIKSQYQKVVDNLPAPYFLFELTDQCEGRIHLHNHGDELLNKPQSVSRLGANIQALWSKSNLQIIECSMISHSHRPLWSCCPKVCIILSCIWL